MSTEQQETVPAQQEEPKPEEPKPEEPKPEEPKPDEPKPVEPQQGVYHCRQEPVCIL